MPPFPQWNHIQMGIHADPLRFLCRPLYQETAAVILMILHMESIPCGQGNRLIQHIPAIFSKGIFLIPLNRYAGNGH